MLTHQAYVIANTVIPVHSNVAYASAGCIEMEANQAYVCNTNNVQTDPYVAYGDTVL